MGSKKLTFLLWNSTERSSQTLQEHRLTDWSIKSVIKKEGKPVPVTEICAVCDVRNAVCFVSPASSKVCVHHCSKEVTGLDLVLQSIWVHVHICRCLLISLVVKMCIHTYNQLLQFQLSGKTGITGAESGAKGEYYVAAALSHMDRPWLLWLQIPLLYLFSFYSFTLNCASHCCFLEHVATVTV